MADRDEYCIKCGYKHDQHLTSDWCCPSDSEQDHKRKNAEITTLKAEVERLRELVKTKNGLINTHQCIPRLAVIAAKIEVLREVLMDDETVWDAEGNSHNAVLSWWIDRKIRRLEGEK